jgi:hypothetical protein
MKRKMKTSLMILFSVASMYAQDSAAQNQTQGAKTTADTKTAKTTTSGKTTTSAKSTRTTAPAAASQAAFGIASSIPKDAQPLGQGKYRAVDAGGEAWIYQNTPFGITKARESDLQKQAAAAPSSPFGASMKTSAPPDGQPAATVTAFPNGDEIRFEKQTPFGKSAWTKKRTDQLNSVEKTALANAEKTTAANGKN